MYQSKSLELGASKAGIAKIFLRSQFCAKPQWPPETTNLSGKTAIITGTTSGLGYYACHHFLAAKLSRLIMAVRSTRKGEEAAARLRKAYPGATIEVWELNMDSYDSIQAFARRVDTDPAISSSSLDIAVLNAGLVNATFKQNKATGHEEALQINFLSTYLLAILLLPALKRTGQKREGKKSTGTGAGGGGGGRLTIVGSGMAYSAQFPNRNQVPLLKSFDATDHALPWDPNERYACSKLLGLLFLTRLAGSVSPADVVMNVVDPGYCKGSDLHRDASGALATFLSLSKTLTGRTLRVGSSTYIDAAVVKGPESHGCFVMDWNICP